MKSKQTPKNKNHLLDNKKLTQWGEKSADMHRNGNKS